MVAIASVSVHYEMFYRSKVASARMQCYMLAHASVCSNQCYMRRMLAHAAIRSMWLHAGRRWDIDLLPRPLQVVSRNVLTAKCLSWSSIVCPEANTGRK